MSTVASNGRYKLMKEQKSLILKELQSILKSNTPELIKWNVIDKQIATKYKISVSTARSYRVNDLQNFVKNNG